MVADVLAVTEDATALVVAMPPTESILALVGAVPPLVEEAAVPLVGVAWQVDALLVGVAFLSVSGCTSQVLLGPGSNAPAFP